MKTDSDKKRIRRLRRRSLAGVVVLAVCGGIAYWRFSPAIGKSDETGPLYTVKAGPLEIAVTAQGTIQSRKSEVVRSQAQGRNMIIWVIEEGKSVTNHQLLVELDASDLEQRRNDQQITVGSADASLEQSKEKLDITKIDNESKISAAELKLRLAKLAREKYVAGEYPQQLQDAESSIATAQEEVQRAEETLGWTKKLAAEGFVTRQELQADESSLRQKRIALAKAITSMNLLTNYTAREQREKLDSDVRQAERDLDSTTRQARSSLSQAESDLADKTQASERQRKKLEDLETQIQNCHIYAPTNGLIIYASTMNASRRRWGGDPLQAGGYVHERQDLMFIPTSGGMIVEFSVPESDLTKLTNGLPATISVEALPDISLRGTLSKIGILPDGRAAWLNPDMNIYNCEISINEEDTEGLRAGMSCQASMQIASYQEVLFVPLQCVLRVGGKPTVFLLEDGKPVPRTVEIGYDNGRFVHVTKGLSEGDQIMLAPPLSAAEVQDGKEEGKEQDSDAPPRDGR